MYTNYMHGYTRAPRRPSFVGYESHDEERMYAGSAGTTTNSRSTDGSC